MLAALIQTIANLGFDSTAISAAFNTAIEALKAGDPTTLEGLTGMFAGVFSALSGFSAADISTVISSIISGVADIISNIGSSTPLTTLG